MSDAEEEEGHSTAIKTPEQLITVLISAFAFPIAIILLLAKLATGDVPIDENNPAFSDKAIANRLKPEGTLVIASGSPQAEETVSDATGQAPGATPAPVAAAGGADAAKTIYAGSCAACHDSGAAGAPKLGDKAAWGERIKTGKDSLYNSALKGKNAMPPKGGNASLSDENVKQVVDYMVTQAQ
ncbi:MAG: cytochrome c5 family protein [Nitrosospira sp.]|nr:cytochrome c5 family protein [Nitrosospira sp.]MBN9126547.1 cytochrome c5 family protein [Nitrosospira sp.]OJY14876.1 MAG: cytochrome c, class I [Nitrosospira sp. 56-18]